MRRNPFGQKESDRPAARMPAVLLPPRRPPLSPAKRSAGAAPAVGNESASGTGHRPGALHHSAELAHDARNLLSALDLYCELLAGPGVLAPQFRHYADDLRRVGQTGARLIEALAESARSEPQRAVPAPAFQRHPFPGIRDLGAELLALEAPLGALAGPEVRLEVECAECAGELGLNAEDLVRILFNLVANAVEAIHSEAPAHGRRFLRITAQRGGGASFLPHRHPRRSSTVLLSVRDNGPGIRPGDLPRIFDPGFSTRAGLRQAAVNPGRRKHSEPCAGAEFPGLGLAIVRQLVEAAGGSVRAISTPGVGTRFDIELPVAGEGLRPGAAGAKNSPRRLALAKGTADEDHGPEKISTVGEERRVQ